MSNRLTIRGMPLFNSSGDIDISSAGFQYAIDTMSYIRSQVIKQIFYEISIADYLPVDVGEAAWKSEVVQNLEFYEGGTFEDGLVMDGSSRSPQVDTALSQLRMPVRTWKKKAAWNIAQIAEAANVGNWDPVEAKLKSLKKNWDLGVQKAAFLGVVGESDMTGFLNNANVNINITLITEEVSGMSDAEFQAFVKGLLNAYYANSNSTRFPDTFIMPTADYLGMATAASATFPNISKLEYLENSLKKMTANEGFKIRPLTYAQVDKNLAEGVNKNRYVLYRNDPETLKLTIPVDITMNQAYTINGFDFEQLAYGQISGVLVNRPREMLYIDRTPTT
jgi:hypothetical protein